MKYLSIFIRVALLALGQSLDCHSASEVSLMGMGKISQCITTTKHSKAKTVCIFLGIYCIAKIFHRSLEGTPVARIIKQNEKPKSMQTNKDSPTWPLTGWQMCRESVRCQVRKPTPTNIEPNTVIFQQARSEIDGSKKERSPFYCDAFASGISVICFWDDMRICVPETGMKGN